MRLTPKLFEKGKFCHHGYGKRAILKDQSLLLGAMMKGLTSPQVGIASMRQLGSCIIVYTSVAAQASQLSAAALEGALPMSIVFSNDSGDKVSPLSEDFVAGLFVGIVVTRQLGSRIIVYISVAAQASHLSAAALEGGLPLSFVFGNDSAGMVSLLLEDFAAGFLVWIAAFRQLGSCNTVDSSAATQAVEVAVAALKGSLPLPSVFSNGFFGRPFDPGGLFFWFWSCTLCFADTSC